MVLYDKKNNFLGISGKELSMLGYESMEEFKSYNDDFADLFINHPGYISKFKNFSWIDYILHSGVSNKNAILRHKNGAEVEASLDIMEVFLLDEINESNSIYNIEINAPISKDDFITTTNPHLKNRNIKLEPILGEPEKNFTKKESIVQKEPIVQKKTEIKDDFSLVSDYEIEDYEKTTDESKNYDEIKDDFSLVSDYEIEDYEKATDKSKSFDEPIFMGSESDVEIKKHISEKAEATTQKSIEPTIKLKVDTFDDIDDIKETEDILKIQTPKIVYEPEKEIEVKIQNNSNILDEKHRINIEKTGNFDEQHKEANDEGIDFTQIIEDTGIDLEDLAMFMGEFLSEAKKMSEVLHSSKDEQLVKNKIVQLKGISSCLQMINFVKILDTIFSNYNTEKFYNYINEFDSKIKNLENQLS